MLTTLSIYLAHTKLARMHTRAHTHTQAHPHAHTHVRAQLRPLSHGRGFVWAIGVRASAHRADGATAPAVRLFPVLIFSRPAIVLSIVVLPIPDGPSKQIISPWFSIVNDTLLTLFRLLQHLGVLRFASRLLSALALRCRS